MPTQAQYQLSTGLITATISGGPGITDSNQIAALQAVGIGVTAVPDGANGNFGMIVNGAYQAYDPPADPLPNPTFQLIAALVNSGVVPATSFHQGTIAQINASLSGAGMSVITAAAKSAAIATPAS